MFVGEEHHEACCADCIISAIDITDFVQHEDFYRDWYRKRVGKRASGVNDDEFGMWGY